MADSIDMRALTAQLAVWLNEHSPPTHYRCLRCNSDQWWVAGIRKVESTDAYLYDGKPGPYQAADVECLNCHRIETFSIMQLRLIT